MAERKTYFPLSVATDTEFKKSIADVASWIGSGYKLKQVDRVFVKKSGATFVEAAEGDAGTIPAGKIVVE